MVRVGTLNLTFHQTFSLQVADLAKVVKCVSENPEAANEEIARGTGLGIGRNPSKGKIQPYLEYAKLAGLLSEAQDVPRRTHALTATGRIVMRHDAHLETTISAWVLHTNLANEASKAGAWAFLFNEFLRDRRTFTRGELRVALTNQFGQIAKLSSINDGVLLNCYLKKEGLQHLGLLEETKKGEYSKGLPRIPNAYIVGYALARLWRVRYATLVQIAASEVLSKGGLCDLMALSAEGAQYWLEELTKSGFLIQHRAVPPGKIERAWDREEDLLLRAYKENEKS